MTTKRPPRVPHGSFMSIKDLTDHINTLNTYIDELETKAAERDAPKPELYTPERLNDSAKRKAMRKYATHAPEVPTWYMPATDGVMMATAEERFFKWRMYYAQRMVEMDGDL